MKTYDMWGWWEECKRNCPALTFEDFKARWDSLWLLAHMANVATDTRGR